MTKEIKIDFAFRVLVLGGLALAVVLQQLRIFHLENEIKLQDSVNVRNQETFMLCDSLNKSYEGWVNKRYLKKKKK